MARQLDPIIADTLKKYGLGKEAVWDCHGVWVVYHNALEKIAAFANIKLDAPQIVEANGAQGIAAICVTGYLDGRAEWSIGEASPKNNKNAYCWAMAEKRAKDRVILKLIGLSGLAYSEDESDDFKPGAKPETHGTTEKPAANDKDRELEYWRKYVVDLCERIDEQPDTRFLADLWVEQTVDLQKLKAFSAKAYNGVVERFQKRGLKEAA